jgi:hypothetical protein
MVYGAILPTACHTYAVMSVAAAYIELCALFQFFRAQLLNNVKVRKCSRSGHNVRSLDVRYTIEGEGLERV